ncbi:MAG: TolC family protein, partial [bacterium]|nr:TolC family protein [bacterium]
VIILAGICWFTYPGDTGETSDFTCLTIDQAIRSALENNKNYRAGREMVRQYKYRLRQNLGFLPTVTLEGIKNLDEKLMQIQLPPVYPGSPPQTATIDFTKNYEFTFQVVQPLFTGGKILYSYKNARLDLKIAGEKYENTRKELILQVKKVFFNILVMKELLKAHKEALQLARTNHTNIGENYKLGMASKYDLLRAELALASVKPDILNVEKLLNLSILNLKFMTGIPGETPVDIVGSFDYTHQPLKPAHLVEKALVNRSEIRQLEIQKKKNANLLRIAYGQFLPDISLTAAYSYRSDLFKLKKDTWEDYYTINLGIRFPIFNQFKRPAQVGELKVMNKILDLNYRHLQDVTRIRTREFYLTMQEEYRNIQTGLKNIETAKEGVRIAQLTYNEGLITILELNASVNDLTKAKVRFFQAVYNYNIAAAELEKISGIEINGGNE